MNKKLGMAVLGAVFFLPLAAQAEGAYVGFNAGRTQQKLKIDQDIDNDHFSLKGSATGYKLYGGYEFNQYFGVQGGYIDMGKAKNPYTYNVNFFQGNMSSKVQSLYIAATASFPLNNQFSLFGKLGIASNQVKITDSWNGAGGSGSVSESQTRTAPLIGIGAAYKFNKNMAVVVEYEDFGKVGKWEDTQLKANMFSVGLRYHF